MKYFYLLVLACGLFNLELISAPNILYVSNPSRISIQHNDFITENADFAPEGKGSIKGKVTDAETGKSLEGAHVMIEGTSVGAATNADGDFHITHLDAGKYTVSASYLGFTVKKQTVILKPETEMSLDFRLTPAILPGQTVVITATRAKERETPVSFSNMDSKEISQRYWAQDIPMLLSELPNVYAYSDNGNGIGYSYMKMRGFSQNRIGVMLNGVPLNDAESHEVFWVDLPDFAASAEDIQVQRGVGKVMYGASSFGGSVNFATLTTVQTPSIEATVGAGSYNTRKVSLAGNSGLIDNTYILYGRYSRIETDGYRNPSWSKLWSYFLSATRFDETMTTRVNVFGGPEQSFLSYKGVTRDEINDKSLRKTNPIQYPNEIDNYFQPHFQLINEWKIGGNLQLDNTLFAFLGKGDYTQYRTRRDVREYNIPRFSIADSTFLPSNYYKTDIAGNPARGTDGMFQVRYLDIVRKRSVDDVDFGWLPRLTWKTDFGDFLFGGEFRRHRGHHWGEVLWANVLPAGIEPDRRYYDYVVPKTSLSLYAHHLHRASDALSIMGEVGLSHHSLRLRDEANFNVEFDRKYTFLNPRIGANYNLTEEINAYINIAHAQREPAFKDVYDPQDYWSNPENLPNNFSKTATGYSYIGKELKPERFINFEVGGGYSSRSAMIKASLFWMDFRDEIIFSGQIDDNGVPITGNAERTLHRGIELSGFVNLFEWLKLSGNFALNDNRFIRHTEYVVTDWNVWPPATSALKFDDNRIGGFPISLGNIRLMFEEKAFIAALHVQHIGKIYLDNTQTEFNALKPVAVFNAAIGYDLGSLLGIQSLRLSLVGNNLLNKMYASGGYIEEGVAYFIPAAERNFFLSLSTKL